MQPFLEEALEGASRFAGAGTAWVDALRREGADRYGERGLPGRRDEYWRYTNLGRMADAGYGLARDGASGELPHLPHRAVAELATYRIVLVNGRLRPDLCVLDGLPDGVLVSGLADMLSAAPGRLEPWLGKIAPLDAMPMAALNTAYLHDGMVLFVEEGVTLDKPVHLVSMVSPGVERAMFQPRHLVVLGRNAEASLIESHIGTGGSHCFNNVVTEIALDEAARLDHFVFQEEAGETIHLAGTAVSLQAHTTYDSFVLQSGGAIGRHEIRAVLEGEEVDCRLDGIYMATGDQVTDNTTHVEHRAPNCRSRQVYKRVLDGRARGIFQGKIHVEQAPQKTDGHQLSRALLLSPRAEIDARPELEIYADDVKCSHGATAGELDEDAMFYLRSRGLEPQTAQRLLIEAFLSEAITEIRQPQVAEDFTAHVRQWLERHVGAANQG